MPLHSDGTSVRGNRVHPLYTCQKQRPLWRGETLCPRWDSNRIPTPANTGNSRKHRQSGPVRPIYDPVRSLKCVRCTHEFFCPISCAIHATAAPLLGRGSSVLCQLWFHSRSGCTGAWAGSPPRSATIIAGTKGHSRQIGFDEHHGKFCYVYPISPASMRALALFWRSRLRRAGGKIPPWPGRAPRRRLGHRRSAAAFHARGRGRQL